MNEINPNDSMNSYYIEFTDIQSFLSNIYSSKEWNLNRKVVNVYFKIVYDELNINHDIVAHVLSENEKCEKHFNQM